MKVNSKQPLLSICIPTYNRAKILDYIISKYVSNQEFNDEVEIVISDNASTDETSEIAQSYADRFKNVKYFRNEENIFDKNFIKVLDEASGKYLKLVNDWIYLPNDALKFMKDRIRENLDTGNNIFFTGHWLDTSFKNESVIHVKGLDQYVQVVSTLVTSNNMFGVWREDWKQMPDKSRYAAFRLNQVDWSYHLMKIHPNAILYNNVLFERSEARKLGRRGGYNWFQVHIDYYYQIMKPYREQGLITDKTYKKDRDHLLNHFSNELCQVLIHKTDKNFCFETKGTKAILWKYYKDDAYAYLFFLFLPFRFCCNYVLGIMRRTKHVFSRLFQN